MKTLPSLTELHRIAVERGMTVKVAGRTINAQAEKLRLRTPQPTVEPPAPAPAPVPPPPPAPAPAPQVDPGVPRDVVDRLLADQEARWSKQVSALTAQLDRLSTSKTPTPPVWNFVPEYGARGEIIRMRAEPTPTE
jgi:hypothetical protein